MVLLGRFLEGSGLGASAPLFVVGVDWIGVVFVSVASKKAMKKRRIRDLMVVGREVPIHVSVDGHDQVEVFWVQALNSLEQQQVLQDARAAQLMAQIHFDRDVNAQSEMEAVISSVSTEELASLVVANRDVPGLEVRVRDELLAEERIQERRELLENFDPEMASEADRLVHDEIVEWYAGERAARLKAAADEAVVELLGSGHVGVAEAYRKLRRSLAGQVESMSAMVRSELFHAVRLCEIAAVGESHDRCDHSELFFESPAEVGSYPDEFLDELRAGLDALRVSESEASK